MIVKVVPYDKTWLDIFKKERELLARQLEGKAINIHHIGSTAVEGLSAKPIIDILIETPALSLMDASNTDLVKLDYEPMGEYGIKGRRYFRKGRDHRTHQIHAFECGDLNIKRHLAFRDYLAAYPNIKLEYAVLKQNLATQYPNDIDGYCDGKDAFIKYHEQKALEWY